MSELGLIRPDMQAAIGRPYGVQVSYPVTASDIRKWVQAIRYPEPAPASVLDPEAALDRRLVAPLDFNPFAWGAARVTLTGVEIPADPAHERTGAMEHHVGIAPPDLFRALNGGVSATYTERRMSPGDVITAESSIAGYSERAGRLGAMLLTDVATTWVDQAGQLLKTYRMTLIRY